jgi:DNA end-binding protein Ku
VALEKHVARKLKSGKDVIRAPEEVVEEYEEESNVIDLMQVLKERLQGRTPEEPSPEQPARQPARKGHGRTKSRRRGKKDLEKLSKEALYERAQGMNIPGRSRMSKQELADALSKRE